MFKIKSYQNLAKIDRDGRGPSPILCFVRDAVQRSSSLHSFRGLILNYEIDDINDALKEGDSLISEFNSDFRVFRLIQIVFGPLWLGLLLVCICSALCPKNFHSWLIDALEFYSIFKSWDFLGRGYYSATRFYSRYRSVWILLHSHVESVTVSSIYFCIPPMYEYEYASWN